jgi:hypothetical protein
MGRSLSRAYHLVALLNACFAKSDMASLFTRIFCIARKLFLMSFSFGLSLNDRVLSGVVSVNGGDVVELPLVTVVLVIGDTVVIPTVDASTTLGGGGFPLCTVRLLTYAADRHLLLGVLILLVGEFARPHCLRHR